ncbi:MAG: FHA domain-containing protein [Alistipes sp.]|nr:FHA domain-containing protein [Alistipes sp.]
MENNYKRTIAGSVGAGMGAIFNASGRRYYILEHKTESEFHHRGESQKIIVDEIELGRDAACQVRFGESFETVSRRHAAIVRDGENWKLIPLSQTNATIVNGQPVNGEWHLNSGDEIRLSSNGPVLGFIVPQGAQSMVKSIGLTERMNLFRKQALAPYKRAILILAIILVLAIAGLVAWNIYQAQQFDKELAEKQQQIELVQSNLEESDLLINELNEELEKSTSASAAERARVQKRLEEAQAEREALLKEAAALQADLQAAEQRVNDATKSADETKKMVDDLNQKIEEKEVKENEAQQEPDLNAIINKNKATKPVLE